MVAGGWHWEETTAEVDRVGGEVGGELIAGAKEVPRAHGEAGSRTGYSRHGEYTSILGTK